MKTSVTMEALVTKHYVAETPTLAARAPLYGGMT